MFGVHHAACPVAFGLLDFGHGSRHRAKLLFEEVAVLVVGRKVLQHLGQCGEHPSVAPCPEVLFAVEALVFGVDVFSIAVIKVLVCVEHDAVGVGDVFVELVEIERVVSHLVEFGHDRHHHVEPVAPPPVVVARGAHLVFHHFACPAYLPVVGGEVVKVDVGLETRLPVAEEHVVVGLAVGVFPLRAVVALGAFPLVVLGPGFRIGTVGFVAGEEVGFHVAGVVGGVVPECPHFGLVFGLPVLVHLVDDGPHAGGFILFGREVCSRQQSDGAGCEGFQDCFHVCHGLVILFPLSAGCAAALQSLSGRLPRLPCSACRPCSIRFPNSRRRSCPDGRC